ncbi:MAG: dockerin type I domain-containing protein [Caldilineaceae bacterium]
MIAGGNSNTAQAKVQAAAIIPGTHYVAQAELFIDSVGTNGTGIAMIASDGLFDSAIEAVYVYIPLTTINALSEGDHPIFVHGLDGAGNWGPAISGTLRIDKTGPLVTNLLLTPNPTQGAATVSVTAVASDTASAVTQAEWFIDSDPGVGSASAMSVTANGLTWDLSANINVALVATGTYTVNVRAKDAAGNWSTVVTSTLTVSSATFVPGDVNGDGNVNIFDLQALINMIQHSPQPDSAIAPLDWWQRADLFPDSAWNIFDLQSLINIIQANGP